jgi:hypothetical protein
VLIGNGRARIQPRASAAREDNANAIGRGSQMRLSRIKKLGIRN